MRNDAKPSANAPGAIDPPPSPKRRGRPSKHGLKREALLEAAAGAFNAQGIAATSLAEIAERLGLSRASVYYYVNDRAELVFQCYQRACELMAEDLAAASEAGTGFEKTLAFIHRALTPGRAPTAVLSEVNYLSPAHAEVVRTANDRNVAALIGFVEAGVADGSIRPCDAEVAAQTIIGTLAWGRLSPQWMEDSRGRKFQARFLAAAVDLLTSGLTTDPGRRFEGPVDAEQFLPKRFNPFDRQDASDMRIEQLLTAASRLFNRDGIEATSLDEITASLGATKGVLYHYLRDKTDLVARCYERGFDLFERFAAAADAHGGDGLERALIGTHLNVQAQAGALTPLVPQPGLEALPHPRRDALVARARRLALLFDRLLRQGVADGSCRAADTRMIALIGAGGFAWLPKWLPPDDPRSPRRLADEISDIYFRGLKAR
ncbi:MAG TPA: TetR family transcriptional regulator [Phenylobacterium sp.]|jgi:AcrR family transcriptional regulator|nr:TetR family transcriptional regulator [Phenylobacterium sp.]